MTKNEINHLDNHSIWRFKSYYGKEFIGIVVDIDSDPYYYIIHDINGWTTAGQSHDENVLDKFGKKVHRSALSTPERVPRGQTRWFGGGMSEDSFDGNIKVKKLVICGAGASFDYNYDDDKKEGDWNPPLGNQLFGKRFAKIIDQFPGVKASLSELRLAKDIEEFFQSEWSDIEEDYRPERLVNLINIQYYLQYLMLEVSKHSNNYESNNYDALISDAYRYTRKSNQKAMIVTFNYDTLLEQSMERIFQFRFNSINDYVINQSNLFLIKPHGSCNWIWPLSKSLNQYTSKEENEVLKTASYFYEQKYNLSNINFDFMIEGKGITMLGEKEDSYLLDLNAARSTYPALLIPYHTKDEFVLPKRHYDHFDFYLNGVEDILIIGWKGRENYFIEQLKSRIQHKINLTVVDMNHEQVKSEVEKAIEVSTYRNFETFSEFVKSGAVKQFWT